LHGRKTESSWRVTPRTARTAALETDLRLGGRRVLLAEFIHAAAGVDDFLLARVERMAIRTNFDLQIVAYGGASLERIAACAGDVDRFVFGMNVGFHENLVIVYGRIEAHRIDAIATPTLKLPAKIRKSMPDNFWGRASYAPALRHTRFTVHPAKIVALKTTGVA
jgi:hypothetical protein